ncbi:MAG: hypothetical protein ACK4UV_04640 [Ignavibacterium sp.]
MKIIKKILSFIKKYTWQSLTFILGAIVVILLTKAADDIIPNNPVIVKEISDSLKVVHTYIMPELSENDSINLLLQKKLNQITQLNLYQKEIDEYYKRIKQKDQASLSDIPNKIILDPNKKLSSKGYIQGEATAYFESNCPDFSRINTLIDFKINFISPEIIPEVYCLRLSIYKKTNNNYNQYVFDEFYEVRSSNNFIRINKSKEYSFSFRNILVTNTFVIWTYIFSCSW